MSDYETKSPASEPYEQREDEEAIILNRDWTEEEEKRAKRKSV
jgi:hypothetical protein